MRSLFIDTHTNQMVLALYENQKLKTKKELEENYNNSAICMPKIIEILAENNITIHDIDEIIVINGPGSFTGIRIGVTIAKTLAYTLNIPIKTLTSFEMYKIAEKESHYLVLSEKNGFYIAYFDEKNKDIKDYSYLTKTEFEQWKNQNKWQLCSEINYEHIIAVASSKPSENCHGIKPLYIKKIEVEK